MIDQNAEPTFNLLLHIRHIIGYIYVCVILFEEDSVEWMDGKKLRYVMNAAVIKGR